MKNPHSHRHAFENFQGRQHEGLTVFSRRGMIKNSLAGIAGLSLPELLRQRASANPVANQSTGKSVILLWMAGGPSHIDTWDPKPDRPYQNRGPFGVTRTKVNGVQICELLPKQAAMLDQFSILRSVDARKSNHEPNMVFQTGHRGAAPRVNPRGETYPAIGSIVAKHHGANQPGGLPYVAFQRSKSHVAYSGYLGKQFDPFIAERACKLPVYDLVGKDTGKISTAEMFRTAPGVSIQRLAGRRNLLNQLDQARAYVAESSLAGSMDPFSRQALALVTDPKVRQAFDLSKEPKKVRDRYGKHLWCQKALTARRLVEAGSAFVTIDLSYHTASGTWDTHGDNIPPYGGIKKGLGPLLPLFDHLLTTLVSDLGERGMLEDVLVIAMGEFGRTPNLGTQESTDGRNHWPVVMSMCLAGGGMRHGQVIGATEADGSDIKSRPITPGDLSATIYRHFGVPQNTTYLDPRGRPNYVVAENGKPIEELF
ncbi:MAG: DUF1501 domain-containing protein [Planctomycetota bacterium]|nr:DUF1501 domain-containing protein [Planctomycetota bacterium]